MAIGVKQSLASMVSSLTGIAAHGGDTELKPIGLVYLGLAAPMAVLKVMNIVLA